MAIESLKRIFQISLVKAGRDLLSSPRKKRSKPGKEEKRETPGKVDIKV